MEKTVRVNLAYLRLARGKLSQRIVSEATGIAQKTLSALETGATKGIDFSTLAKLCAYFNCTPNDLLSLEAPVDWSQPSPAALTKADELIAKGLELAIKAPGMPTSKLWAEFDKACEQVRNSAERDG